MMPPTRKLFWPRVDRTGGCWLWRGFIDKVGYGWGCMNGKPERAHRIAYTMFFGLIPKGLCVCHSCDVRNCCNPYHLFLGTHGDNARDRQSKGRTVGAFRKGHAFQSHEVRYDR